MPDNGLLNALEVLLPKYVLTAVYHEDFFLYLTAFLGVVMPSCVYFFYQYVYGVYTRKVQERLERRRKIKLQRSAITVFYALTNEAEESLPLLVASRFPTENPPVVNLADVKKDKFRKFQGIGLFVISMASHGHEPADTKWFFDWLEESLHSSRKHSKRKLYRMRFAVFGYGDSGDRNTRYNKASKILAKRLHALGCDQIIPVYSVDRRKKESLEEHVDFWIESLLTKVESSSSLTSDSSSSSGTPTAVSTSTDTACF